MKLEDPEVINELETLSQEIDALVSDICIIPDTGDRERSESIAFEHKGRKLLAVYRTSKTSDNAGVATEIERALARPEVRKIGTPTYDRSIKVVEDMRDIETPELEIRDEDRLLYTCDEKLANKPQFNLWVVKEGETLIERSKEGKYYDPEELKKIIEVLGLINKAVLEQRKTAEPEVTGENARVGLKVLKVLE